PLTQHESEDGLTATCVVARATFDEALFRHALACGANFRVANIKGPLVENGRVVGVTETSHGVEVNTYGHIVIGADGATSAIARGLDRRRRTAKDWAVALRGYVDTEVDLDGTIELAFLDEVQPGYA